MPGRIRAIVDRLGLRTLLLLGALVAVVAALVNAYYIDIVVGKHAHVAPAGATLIEKVRALKGMKIGITGPGSGTEALITYLFKLAAARAPDAGETAEMLTLHKEALATYSRDVEAAKKLITVGETKPDAKLNPSEVAAWTLIGNLVLNLDEVINKN